MASLEEVLMSPILGQAAWRWMTAAATAVGCAFVPVLIRYRVSKDPTHPGVLGDLRIALTSIRRLPVLAIAIFLGSRWLALPPGLGRFIYSAFVIAVGIQIGLSTVAVARRILKRYIVTSSDDPAEASVGVLGTVAEFIIWTILLLMVLSNLDLNVSGLVASLGVGGIAIALAAQNILGDLFASLSIVLDRPFEPGDFIKVGNELGVVRRVGLKTTRVAALQGEELVFCNTDLLGSRIQNFKKMRQRRVVLEVALVYSTPMESLKAVPGIIEKAVRDTAGCRFDRAHFRNFGESALVFEAVYYVDTNDFNAFMDRQQTINFSVLSELRSREIRVALPTRTLHLNESSASLWPSNESPAAP